MTLFIEQSNMALVYLLNHRIYDAQLINGFDFSIFHVALNFPNLVIQFTFHASDIT